MNYYLFILNIFYDFCENHNFGQVEIRIQNFGLVGINLYNTVITKITIIQTVSTLLLEKS